MQRFDSLYIDGKWRAASSGFDREGGSLGIKDYFDVKYTNMVLM